MKTNELTGALLDLWVARAMKLEPIPGEPEGFFYWGACSSGWWCPSTDWEQAGPIIERERISIEYVQGLSWFGLVGESFSGWGQPRVEPMAGATPLIAAMRAYVASVYGNTVPQQSIAENETTQQ